MDQNLRSQGLVVIRGGDYDSWDLQARGGLFGSALIQFAIEDHGAGTQYIRARLKPKTSKWWPAILVVTILATSLSAADGAYIATALLFLMSSSVGIKIAQDCGRAEAASARALATLHDSNGFQNTKS